MTEFFLDLETRSRADVKKVGVYAMSEDPTLRILSAHFAFDDGPVSHWRGAFAPGPQDDEQVNEAFADLLDAIEDGARGWAHNAAFDFTIWNACAERYDFPRLRPGQLRDSAVVCRALNLPGALGAVAKATGGAKLPNKTFHPLWKIRDEDEAIPDTDAFQALYEEMLVYGDMDVEEMRRQLRLFPTLPERIWREYEVSEIINRRGVRVDLDWCREAVSRVVEVGAEVSAELEYLTFGAVKTPKQSAAAREWFELELSRAGLIAEDEHVTKQFKKRRADGVGFYTEERPSFDRATRREWRERLLEHPQAEEIAHVIDMLDLMEEGAAAATAKYAAAIARASKDGRLRGMYVFGGAQQTGRYTAGGLQPHNLVRAKVKGSVPEAQRRAGTLAEMSKLLRTTITARPGTRLIWCDWSAIEARMAPWLAWGCTPQADESILRLLGMFERGEDVYLSCASDIAGEPVTDKNDPRRQSIGKVPVLSLGFLGGIGALNAMARNYGVPMFPEHEGKQIVTRWRDANPWAQAFGAALERAAFAAINAPGDTFPAGRCKVVYHGGMFGGTLFVFLPCGRPLVYPTMRVETVERFEGQPEPTLVYTHATYGRTALWKGAMIENVTQGTAASILREKLVCLEEDTSRAWTVAHTHDEIVQECAVEDVEAAEARLVADMSRAPEWAAGLPLDAEAGSGYRYYAEGSEE